MTDVPVDVDDDSGTRVTPGVPHALHLGEPMPDRHGGDDG